MLVPANTVAVTNHRRVAAMSAAWLPTVQSVDPVAIVLAIGIVVDERDRRRRGRVAPTWSLACAAMNAAIKCDEELFGPISASPLVLMSVLQSRPPFLARTDRADNVQQFALASRPTAIDQRVNGRRP